MLVVVVGGRKEQGAYYLTFSILIVSKSDGLVENNKG